MNKPDWKDAPDWAYWLAQSGSPSYRWTWFEIEPWQTIHGWIKRESSRSESVAGELNLKWQQSLERRP